MAKATPMSPTDDSQFHSDVIHWNDEPVATTAQLAAFYEVDENQLRQNFKRNAIRFEEGRHHFYLTGAELKRFKDCVTDSHTVQIPKRTPNLTLWTRRGAARHAKMLNSERAWAVFEALEDSYFAPAPQEEPDYFGEDMPPLYVPQALAMVRLALDIWGKAHAAEVWRRVGLPVISVDGSPDETHAGAHAEGEPVKRSDPRAGSDEARILEVIRDSGEEGVLRSVITRRFRTIRAVDIDDILDGFETSGLIRRIASASAASRSGIVLIAV